MIIVIGNTADPPFYKPISYFCQKSKMTTNEAPSCPKSIRTKQLFPKHREASVGAILDAQKESFEFICKKTVCFLLKKHICWHQADSNLSKIVFLEVSNSEYTARSPNSASTKEKQLLKIDCQLDLTPPPPGTQGSEPHFINQKTNITVNRFSLF